MKRPGMFLLGVAALAAAWWGPLAELAQHAFYGHMAVHMTVVAGAAPFLALGLAGGNWDPIRRWPDCCSPLVASMLELVVVWLWHMPLLHEAAGRSGAAMAAEQGSFLASGFLLWISVFGGSPERRAERGAIGIVALLLTLMHMTLLGALLALSPRPLYAHHSGAAGLSPLQDQELGGAIMLVVGSVSYIAGALWLTSRLLLRPRRY
ncbi:MAG: cytochrome c oxidase assembly protein [Bryobacteraceae bacterium]